MIKESIKIRLAVIISNVIFMPLMDKVYCFIIISNKDITPSCEKTTQSSGLYNGQPIVCNNSA